MKRPTAFFLSVLLFCLTLVSCANNKPQKSCREILGAIVEAEIALPSGKFYSLSSPEGDDEYLSKSLLMALLGSGSAVPLREHWLDLALFLPFGDHPAEFALILCRDRDTAIDTAKILNSRLAAIKVTKTAPQYKDMVDRAKVTVVGNYALLIISTDPDQAVRIFMKNK